jgi:hypothetical protein
MIVLVNWGKVYAISRKALRVIRRAVKFVRKMCRNIAVLKIALIGWLFTLACLSPGQSPGRDDSLSSCAIARLLNFGVP